MTVLPAALPGVTVKSTLVAPAGTVAVAGTVATVGVPLERLTTTPFVPAGADRSTVRVPSAEPKFSGVGPTVITTGVKVTVAVPDTKVCPDPVMVVVPAVVPGVTGTFTVVAPEGTVTLVGTVATAVLLLERLTTVPLVPAATERVSVSEPTAEPKASGSGERVTTTGAGTVIVTVEGLELEYGSLTIS